MSKVVSGSVPPCPYSGAYVRVDTATPKGSTEPHSFYHLVANGENVGFCTACGMTVKIDT
jgi:hypothetical protein